MKPVYFFLGANSEEGFFSLYDQLLGGRLARRVHQLLG